MLKLKLPNINYLAFKKSDDTINDMINDMINDTINDTINEQFKSVIDIIATYKVSDYTFRDSMSFYVTIHR